MTLNAEETVTAPTEQAPEHSDTPAVTTQDQPAPTTTAAPEGSTPDAEDLLSAEEYAKVRDNPEDLRKAYNKAYTKYRQDNKPYERIIEALRSDAPGAVRQMAKELGLTVAEVQAAVDGKDTEATDEIRQILTDSLGEDLAGKLLPAFTKLVHKVTEERIAPLTEGENARMLESAIAESEAVVNGFKGAHPDYAKYEPKMLELAKTIQPGQGMKEVDFLRTLYRLAKAEATEGDLTKEAIERANKAAETTEPIGGGTPPSQVSKRAPDLKGKDLVRAAVAAAIQGQAWEQE